MEQNAYGGRAEQFLPGERRDITYVSRLQCVQAAVATQIETLAAEHPKKKVAIVTFASDVTVMLPDGTKHVISGAKLDDYGLLLGIAQSLGLSHGLSVSAAKEALLKQVYGLQEGGSTALGPALLVSIGLAGLAHGSSVVLCTGSSRPFFHPRVSSLI